jgi:hypothetical protein
MSQFQWRYGKLLGSGLLVIAAPPAGEPFVLETRIDPDRLEEAHDRLELRFGENLIAGSREGTRVRLEFPDFSCDLTLRNLLNPWHPGDGYLYPARRRDVYTRHAVVAPFAAVSGRLTVRGREVPATGWSYADRGLVVLPLQRMNQEEFSFRVFGPGQDDTDGTPWMLSLLESVTARSYGSRRVGSLLAARGGEWVLATDEHSFTPEEYRGEPGVPFPYPRRMRIQAARDGSRVEGEFVVDRLIYLNDILKKLPPVFREVVEALIRRPVIYRLAGTFYGTYEAPDGTRQSLLLPGQGEYAVFR